MTNQVEKLLENIESKVTVMGERSEANETQVAGLETLLNSMGERLTALETGSKKRKAANLEGLEQAIRTGEEVWSWRQAMRGIMLGDWGRGFEKSVFDEINKRAANLQDTDNKGGYLVPTVIQDMIVEKLQQRAMLTRLGITIWDNLSGGTINVPFEQTSPTITGRADDDTALTETDVTFGQKTLSGNEAGALLPISEKLIRNSGQSQALDAWLGKMLVRAGARHIDEKGIKGTGTDEPTGIINQSGITDGDSYITAGDKMNFVALSRLKSELEIANAWDETGKMGILWHPTHKHHLRTQQVEHYSTQSSGKGFVLPPIVGDAQLAEIMGMQHAATTHLVAPSGSNTGETVIGNWEEFVMAFWGTMELRASEHFKFNKAHITLRLLFEFDCVPLQDAAFIKIDTWGVTDV